MEIIRLGYKFIWFDTSNELENAWKPGLSTFPLFPLNSPRSKSKAWLDRLRTSLALYLTKVAAGKALRNSADFSVSLVD